MSYFTRTPSFPANSDDYAPWVAKYGLLAPYGECQCGCGELVSISAVTRNKSGFIKGDPLRYLIGHVSARRNFMAEPNPSGLCMCGCGQPAPIATFTDAGDGNIAGKPIRFIHNHHMNIQPSLEERFWAKVDKRGPDECWEWMGSRNDAGYGRIRVDGDVDYVHRVSYLLHYGPIPDELRILHKCDNPPCGNPFHLFSGTHQDNMDDMVKKGRHRSKQGGVGKGLF